MDKNKDINGKESSKRVWANRILWTTVITLIGYILLSILFSMIGIPLAFEFPFEAWGGLLTSGTAMQTSTLFEKKM
jgi:hypothetical protein